MEDFRDFEDNKRLIEQEKVRQHKGEPFRRIFFSKLVQIDLWYTDETAQTIYGTQITLNEKEVITAIDGKPISYTVSEENPNLNQSAILRADGLADMFQIESILVPLLDQLPEQESVYLQKLIEEINKNNYVQYPII